MTCFHGEEASRRPLQAKILGGYFCTRKHYTSTYFLFFGVGGGSVIKNITSRRMKVKENSLGKQGYITTQYISTPVIYFSTHIFTLELVKKSANNIS